MSASKLCRVCLEQDAIRCVVGHENEGAVHENTACAECWRQHIELRSENNRDMRCLSCTLPVSKAFLVKRVGMASHIVVRMRNRVTEAILATKRFNAKYKCSVEDCASPAFMNPKTLASRQEWQEFLQQRERLRQQQREQQRQRRWRVYDDPQQQKWTVCMLSHAIVIFFFLFCFLIVENIASLFVASLTIAGLALSFFLVCCCVLWYRRAFQLGIRDAAEETHGENKEKEKTIQLLCLSGHNTEKVVGSIDFAVFLTTRPCPKCHVRIERSSGCDHVVCTRCQQAFCYACNRSKQDYEEACDCTRRAVGQPLLVAGFLRREDFY